MNIIAIDANITTNELIKKIKHLTSNIEDLHIIRCWDNSGILEENGFNVNYNFDDYWDTGNGYFNVKGIIFDESGKDTEDYKKAKENKIPIRIIR